MIKKPTRRTKDRYFSRMAYPFIVLSVIYFHILSLLPPQLTQALIQLIRSQRRWRRLLRR